MPAKSRAQQRLMQAVGSEAGKPVHVQQQRALHPALAARAAAVKVAHAHLSATVPGFRSKLPAEQFAHTQRHIRTKLTRKG